MEHPKNIIKITMKLLHLEVKKKEMIKNLVW